MNTTMATTDNAAPSPKARPGATAHSAPAISDAGRYKLPVTKL